MELRREVSKVLRCWLLEMRLDGDTDCSFQSTDRPNLRFIRHLQDSSGDIYLFS